MKPRAFRVSVDWLLFGKSRAQGFPGGHRSRSCDAVGWRGAAQGASATFTAAFPGGHHAFIVTSLRGRSLGAGAPAERDSGRSLRERGWRRLPRAGAADTSALRTLQGSVPVPRCHRRTRSRENGCLQVKYLHKLKINIRSQLEAWHGHVPRSRGAPAVSAPSRDLRHSAAQRGQRPFGGVRLRCDVPFRPTSASPTGGLAFHIQSLSAQEAALCVFFSIKAS